MAKLGRRKLLIGGAVVAGGAALALGRSSDESGPRRPYFLEMQKALKAASIAQPTLVVDRARLNANVDRLMSDLPEGMGYRIVAKSLPSLGLLDHLRARSGTDRLMTFNLPMLLALSQAMPEANQLLGKPLPAQAVKNFFVELPQDNAEATAKIEWLVDTPERLAQYAAIAEAEGADMAINIELDVGLHRRGMEPGAALTGMMETIRKSNRLRFGGLMGYEPHLSKVPIALGWRERATNGAWEIYRAALDAANNVFGEADVKASTRNAAGSPTYRLYKNIDIANEMAVGSVLVKPTDFDTDLLEAFQPTAFIATPAIKVLGQTQLPAMEFVDSTRRMLNPNFDKTVFTYGGRWMVHPEDPPGLRYNSTFGRSSNQEMLNGGPNTEIKPDDFVFLRPTQSEAVFLQFGDIAVYENGAIIDRWPVFPSSA